MRWRTWGFRVLVTLLLLPAVALTVVRFVQPDYGPAIRAVGYTPYALPLYFVVFLLMLIVLVRRSGRTRWTGLVGMLTLAGLVTHLLLIAPEFAGDAAEPGEGEQEFRVMTLNLYNGGADPVDVVRVAALHRVTTLVLQEVTPEALEELDAAGLDEAFEFRAGEPGDGVTGTMIFSTFRLRSAERLDTASGGWSAEAVLPQGVLRLYAVHPRPPQGDASGWTEDLESLIEAVDSETDLDLIMGDLNATPDHRVLHDLADLDFHSAAERSNSGWQPTWPDQGFRSLAGVPLPRLVQIDHVLVGRSMAAVATNTEEIHGTDHRALIAEVAFR